MKYLHLFVLSAFLAGIFSCTQKSSSPEDAGEDTGEESKSEVIRKKRADGTLSSVNQVDEMGLVHGLRVTYFEDGKTVYSKFNFSHGKKHGPSIRYYRNGQVFEHTEFVRGKKHGVSRKYHKDGTLLSECSFEEGHPLPGLKEYREDGTLISSYPEVVFREIDRLAYRNRVDLEMSCTSKVNGVKYYRLTKEGEKTNRIYLISEDNASTLQFYVDPGTTLEERIGILAEIPTEYGNLYVRELYYELRLTNTK
jgi:antitoxin component YwqK of YwqJK toxin-antitoxin module